MEACGRRKEGYSEKWKGSCLITRAMSSIHNEAAQEREVKLHKREEKPLKFHEHFKKITRDSAEEPR